MPNLARQQAKNRPSRGVAAATLALIQQHPETKAAELAEHTGRELLAFKRDVRKLKELGLTESLERGYRLSPRGRVVFARPRA